MNMKKLKVGNTYTVRCFGDHDLVIKWTIIKRTEKTVTATNEYEGTKTFRIKVIDGKECVKVADGFGYMKED